MKISSLPELVKDFMTQSTAILPEEGNIYTLVYLLILEGEESEREKEKEGKRERGEICCPLI